MGLIAARGKAYPAYTVARIFSCSRGSSRSGPCRTPRPRRRLNACAATIAAKKTAAVLWR